MLVCIVADFNTVVDYNASRISYVTHVFLRCLYCALDGSQLDFVYQLADGDFAHILPERLSVPPRLHTSSSTSVLSSVPMAPLISNATPRGLCGSKVTAISTWPDMGGRSGDDIRIRGWPEGCGSGIPLRSAVSKRESGAEVVMYTLTGILRGIRVPIRIFH